MTWYKDKHGLAAYEDLPILEMERRAKEEGVRFYASLGGLILNEGVRATSINRIAAEKLYDGVSAIRNGTTKGLEPVDVVASYNVEVLDGVIQPRQTSNETVRQAYWEAELERTGERQYSVAILDIPLTGARLFFMGAGRQGVDLQVAEAVRRIYPDEESLYTAIESHDLMLSRGYAKGRPDDAMIARFIDKSGQRRYYLGADSRVIATKAVADLGGRPGEDIVDLVGRSPEIDFCLGFMSHNEGHIEHATVARREQEVSTGMSM